MSNRLRALVQKGNRNSSRLAHCHDGGTREQSLKSFSQVYSASVQLFACEVTRTASVDPGIVGLMRMPRNDVLKDEVEGAETSGWQCAPNDGRRLLSHAGRTLRGVLASLRDSNRSAAATGGFTQYEPLFDLAMTPQHHAFGCEGNSAEMTTLPARRFTYQQMSRVLSGLQVLRELIPPNLRGIVDAMFVGAFPRVEQAFGWSEHARRI